MYTIKDWKEFKTKHGLNNSDIAEIIGTSMPNVRQHTSPKAVEEKGLPAWAKGMLWVDKNPIQNKLIEASEDINDIETKAEVVCGCSMQGRFFKIDKGCKIPREKHTF